jgi:hypothetical protein
MTDEELITRPLIVIQRLEGLFELRRDRDVEALAGRKSRDEPFLVERDRIAVGADCSSSGNVTMFSPSANFLSTLCRTCALVVPVRHPASDGVWQIYAPAQHAFDLHAHCCMFQL